MKALMIAAPASGSGKTVITLALARALADRGLDVAAAKAGPDYIDPQFQALAARRPCINLDPFAMRPALIEALARHHAGDGLLLVEAMMGLFDGAADGTGSPADLAALLDMPVVLVIDCARMSQSVGAIARGYATHRADICVIGVILNRVGSPRHEAMLRQGMAETGISVLGVIGNDAALCLPSRHLGLVQAGDLDGVEAFIAHAAETVAPRLDLNTLVARAAGITPSGEAISVLPPPGQRVAIARDKAFAFTYEHMLSGWQDQGASLSFFSPLADEAPAGDCDAVFLPGGYPELHAGRLAAASRFKAGLAGAVARGATVYGECGGYMVLGDALIDADGTTHAMTGHLPLVTSFAQRKRHLGYRRMAALPETGFFWGMPMTGHEFHYSSTVSESGDPLFAACDATGADLGSFGLCRGRVFGSYLHVIDRSDA